MKFNKKRGFTIVELIIVIAVIAILAAVLIPVFSNLIQQGKDADSKVLVNTLNKGVAMSGKNDYDTMHEVLAVVEQNVGVDVAKLNAAQAKGNTILWDSTNKTFVFLKSDGTYVAAPEVTRVDTAKYNLWKISDNTADLTDENGYSIYWTGENLVNQKVVNGFDAGKSEITSINYERATGAEAKSVVIRTNGGSLTVNAKTDDIKHYGAADLVDVQAVKDNSFHEFGTVAVANVKDGHFVAEKSAVIINVHVEATTASVKQENGAKVFDYTKEDTITTEVKVEGTDTVISETAKADEVKTDAANSSVVAENGVAEVNGVQFKTLQAAFNKAKNNDTIVVKSNIDLDCTVSLTSGNNVTLDMNGKKLYNTVDLWDNPSADSYNWSLVSVRSGNLTITGNGVFDAKVNDCYTIDVQDGAKCTIENGLFNSNISAVYVYAGELTVNGGTFKIQQLNSNGQGGYAYVLNCFDDNRKAGLATIAVTGGTFMNFNCADNVAEGKHTNFCADGYGVTDETTTKVNEGGTDYTYYTVVALSK